MSDLLPGIKSFFGKVTKPRWANSKKQPDKPQRKRSGSGSRVAKREHDAASKRQKTRRRRGSDDDSDTTMKDRLSFEELTDPDGFKGVNGPDGFPVTRKSDDGDSATGSGGGVSEDEYSVMEVETEDTTAAEESMRQQFGDPRGIMFQGIVGRGNNAIAALLQDNRVNPPRRLILKRPLRDDDISLILNEIKVLGVLQGAMHSVQLLNNGDQIFDAPNLPGASIALEYVENGSFTRLLERCNEAKMRVPNRVLWSLMLCLIRACVSLTWPTGGDSRKSIKLETVPRKREPNPYAHNDLHLDNIMFGNIEPDPAEHCMVPPIKLIDFGQATQGSRSKGPPDEGNQNPHQGEHSNVYKMGEAMMRLIAGTKPLENLPTFKTKPAHLSGVETHATLLWADDEDGDRIYRRLDRPLRRLIGRMMACNYKDRPLLEDILDTAHQAVRHRTAEDYPGFEDEENDEAIAAFVNRFFFSSPSVTDEPFADEEGLITPPADSSP
ncbi:hypothetical protein PG984_012417 [Apiospora sp. TS-2023a]